jgi:hypothetical protein
MSRSHYRWVIVAAGGLLGCVAIGAMFSLPVFLRPISRDTGWSITGVSSAMTFGFLAMALASIIWGNHQVQIMYWRTMPAPEIPLAVALHTAHYFGPRWSNSIKPASRVETGS